MASLVVQTLLPLDVGAGAGVVDGGELGAAVVGSEVVGGAEAGELGVVGGTEAGELGVVGGTEAGELSAGSGVVGGTEAGEVEVLAALWVCVSCCFRPCDPVPDDARSSGVQPATAAMAAATMAVATSVRGCDSLVMGVCLSVRLIGRLRYGNHTLRFRRFAGFAGSYGSVTFLTRF
jgi:hypothetical protein